MNLPHISRSLPPEVIKIPLLLAELCPVNAPELPDYLVAQPLAFRARQLTSVLKKVISPTSWRHGGINE